MHLARQQRDKRLRCGCINKQWVSNSFMAVEAIKNGYNYNPVGLRVACIQTNSCMCIYVRMYAYVYRFICLLLLFIDFLWNLLIDLLIY